jgi:lycopene cyclase domain-containing protein
VTYTVLAVLGVAGAALVDQAVWRTNLLRRKAFWTTYGLMLVFQLVVNGVLTGLPVVRYDRQAITGVRIANAPVEDLLFGFAMIVLTLSTWVWLGRRGAPGASTRRR